MGLGWETLPLEYWAEQARESASFGSRELQLKQTETTFGIRRLHHHACILYTCRVSRTLETSRLQSVMCKKPDFTVAAAQERQCLVMIVGHL